MPVISASIISLVLGYMLSQFYRAFLAVLSPVLGQELGATPDDLALSSGLWFIAFAVMQIPVGWALDQIGPRRTVAVLLGLGGGAGAAVFALATAPWHLHLSMALLGIGCSPALMGPYFIFAREYPPAAFATLAGMLIGLGSLGNILGAAPLVWLIEAIGWRSTLWWLTGVTISVAIAIWLIVGAWRGASHAIDQLMDREWDDEKRDRFLAMVKAHPELHGIHELRTRTSGGHDFAQFHIWLDPDMTVREAHDVMDEVDAMIRREFPDVDILIHPDPKGLHEPGQDTTPE